MRRISNDEWGQVRVHGRYNGKLPVTLYYAGSAIEFNIKAGNLTAVIDASFGTMEQWITVLVNGAFISRQMLYQGENLVPIFVNMNPDKVKTIRIIKETECFPDDSSAHMTFKHLITDGEIVKAPEKKPMLIEFIGDSITAGEGTMGDQNEDEWIPMFFSGYYNYTRMVAEVLNADYRTVSMGGWGIYCGWDNNIHCNIPSIYTKVCGLLPKLPDKLAGSLDDYDFTRDPANAVVINLGTNDFSGFNQPSWTDTDGCTYKLNKNEDDTLAEESVQKVCRAGVDFLKLVRAKNPDAKILWALGMLGNGLEPVVLRFIDEYKTETGDEKISYVALDDTTDETRGSRFHPGLMDHVKACEKIVAALSE